MRPTACLQVSSCATRRRRRSSRRRTGAMRAQSAGQGHVRPHRVGQVDGRGASHEHLLSPPPGHARQRVEQQADDPCTISHRGLAARARRAAPAGGAGRRRRRRSGDHHVGAGGLDARARPALRRRPRRRPRASAATAATSPAKAVEPLAERSACLREITTPPETHADSRDQALAVEPQGERGRRGARRRSCVIAAGGRPRGGRRATAGALDLEHGCRRPGRKGARRAVGEPLQQRLRDRPRGAIGTRVRGHRRARP